MRCALPVLLSLAVCVAPSAQSGDLAALERATELTPARPDRWYALGQAYNAIKQEAIRSFDGERDPLWQQLLFAETLRANGKYTEAFALYRSMLERLTRSSTYAVLTVPLFSDSSAAMRASSVADSTPTTM